MPTIRNTTPIMSSSFQAELERRRREAPYAVPVWRTPQLENLEYVIPDSKLEDMMMIGRHNLGMLNRNAYPQFMELLAAFKQLYPLIATHRIEGCQCTACLSGAGEPGRNVRSIKMTGYKDDVRVFSYSMPFYGEPHRTLHHRRSAYNATMRALLSGSVNLEVRDRIFALLQELLTPIYTQPQQLSTRPTFSDDLAKFTCEMRHPINLQSIPIIHLGTTMDAETFMNMADVVLQSCPDPSILLHIFHVGIDRTGVAIPCIHGMPNEFAHWMINRLRECGYRETQIGEWVGHYQSTSRAEHGTQPPDYRTCPACTRRFLAGNGRPMGNVSRFDSTGLPIQVQGGQLVCANCSSSRWECDECQRNTTGTAVRADDHDGMICSSCVRELRYHRCDRCRTYTEPGHSSCDTCRGVTIQPYSRDPDVTPRGTGPRFYGVELEVVAASGSRTEASRRVIRWWDGDAICKNDGSLPETGFEIVTSPGDLNWHREKWKGFLGRDRRTSGAVLLRSFGESSCGFHIHYSKRSISTVARARLMQFMMDPNNEPFICSIAGRRRNNYCRTEPIPVTAVVADTGTNHYSALNLCNHATDEARVFKGTLNLKRVLMYLDFLDSLMDYCSQATLPLLRGKSFGHYKAFVLAHDEKWPYLHRFFSHGDAWLKRNAFDADRLLEIPTPELAATDE